MLEPQEGPGGQRALWKDRKAFPSSFSKVAGPPFPARRARRAPAGAGAPTGGAAAPRSLLDVSRTQPGRRHSTEGRVHPARLCSRRAGTRETKARASAPVLEILTVRGGWSTPTPPRLPQPSRLRPKDHTAGSAA